MILPKTFKVAYRKIDKIFVLIFKWHDIITNIEKMSEMPNWEIRKDQVVVINFTFQAFQAEFQGRSLYKWLLDLGCLS